ncbi:MAG: OmpA family protein [Paracoccaceae bacterium]|nr:OmpA family protein [Paracoccaceae bacterium]
MPKALLLSLAIAAVLAQPAAADCRFTLNFAHGSARLSLADSQLLAVIARAYPEGPVALSAHSDDDGTPAQNARLAQARAEAVSNRLRRDGLRSGAVTPGLALSADWDVVPSRGWSSPLNRRVEVFVGGCDPKAHPEARPLDTPGAAFDAGGRLMLTSPRLPEG